MGSSAPPTLLSIAPRPFSSGCKCHSSDPWPSDLRRSLAGTRQRVSARAGRRRSWCGERSSIGVAPSHRHAAGGSTHLPSRRAPSPGHQPVWAVVRQVYEFQLPDGARQARACGTTRAHQGQVGSRDLSHRICVQTWAPWQPQPSGGRSHTSPAPVLCVHTSHR